MCPTHDRWTLALATMQLATRTIDDIQTGVQAAGFDDVTPLQGFAFMRVSGRSATTQQLADHLGITKQASGQLVDRLVHAGYLRRVPHPQDRRAQLLELTDRGHACTVAARAAAEKSVGRWRDQLTPDELKSFQSAILTLTVASTTARPPL